MASTITLDRPARQAPPDKLASETAPLPSVLLPLDHPLSPSSGIEAALAPASAQAPALADIIFDDYPLMPPDTEASAAASFKIDSFDKAAWAEEFKLHDAHFEQLAYHLPKELVQTKAALEKRLAEV